MQQQRVQIITKSLNTLLDFTPLQSYYWEKKTGSDETLRISNTKSKELEPGQLQQAEQAHLVPLTPVPAIVPRADLKATLIMRITMSIKWSELSIQSVLP